MGSTQSTWECATSRPLYCHSSRPPARSSVSSWACPTLLRKRLEKSRTSVPWTEMAWPLPSRSTTTCPAPPSPKGSTLNTKSRKMIWRSTPLRGGERYARQVHHPQAQEGSHIPADVWRGISHVGSAMDLAFFGLRRIGHLLSQTIPYFLDQGPRYTKIAMSVEIRLNIRYIYLYYIKH